MYLVFHRRCWKRNPEWPNGREPYIGKKTIIQRNVKTAAEAQAICKRWNATHRPGKYSDKAEFMEQ